MEASAECLRHLPSQGRRTRHSIDGIHLLRRRRCCCCCWARLAAAAASATSARSEGTAISSRSSAHFTWLAVLWAVAASHCLQPTLSVRLRPAGQPPHFLPHRTHHHQRAADQIRLPCSPRGLLPVRTGRRTGATASTPQLRAPTAPRSRVGRASPPPSPPSAPPSAPARGNSGPLRLVLNLVYDRCKVLK